MSQENGKNRPEIIENAPMHYAPENELGVVFLFCHVAKRLRLKIETIRAGYPDCIAYQRTAHGDKRIQIEFEYRSRNFQMHGHKAKDCDWIVCWEHNWPAVPKRIHVVELRRLFGLGFNVWIMPVQSPYKEKLWAIENSTEWNVPSLSAKGDLVLFYGTQPDSSIKDVFHIATDVYEAKQDWRRNVTGAGTGKKDYFAELRRVCRLKSPIFFEDMQNDRILKTAAFVRGRMQGRPNVSEFWPYLYDKIISRNVGMESVLKQYSPDNLT